MIVRDHGYSSSGKVQTSCSLLKAPASWSSIHYGRGLTADPK